MTGWNEDNFLEQLLAQARQEGGAQRDPCPDAETLCAVLEGEAPAPLREQVTDHLGHCRDCASLQGRLLNFEAGSSPEPEAVWKETRKRLDNWLEGFLRSEAANLRAAKSTAPSREVDRRETFWSPFISWMVPWGVGVVVLLVLIADGMLVMKLRHARPPQMPVAARPAVPPNPPVSAVPTENQAEKGGPQEGINKPLRAPQEQGMPQVAEHAPVGAPLVGARAKQEQGLPQVAATLPSSPPPNAAAGPATEHLPSVRLEPGAHLLIALSSVERLRDGSFQFHGILLLPVVHTGPVPLDRGAEVFGAGTMSQGQTSLAVTEFVVQGAHYALKGGNGAMKAQTPGAGGAVQFERSQVLEMWPASPSVYEKAPDTTAQPEPQK
jgi:hypothetical protein